MSRHADAAALRSGAWLGDAPADSSLTRAHAFGNAGNSDVSTVGLFASSGLSQ